MKALIFVLALLLGVSIVYAASVSTTTLIYFNIATVVGMTNTLLGQSATTATNAGAATANVEFNSSTGSNTCVEAKVVGGTTQSTGNPIMTLDNTGTVNLNLSMKLMSANPACIVTSYKTTYACASAAVLAATNVTILADYTPAAAAQALYLWANFTACTTSDTTSRTLNITGTN